MYEVLYYTRPKEDKEMAKLTASMTKALEQIIDYIDLAKKYDNYHDYYMAKSLRGMEDRKDYDELVAWYESKYEKVTKGEYFESIYLGFWKDARENDIAHTMGVSSSTLRALESRGYITIIEDGRDLVDKVKLLKR